MPRFADILETVGNTPVVRINRLAPPNVTVYVKIEAFNPLRSVKDRLALGVIEDAERSAGERYLSTPLFADIPAEMTEEEAAIASRTPSPSDLAVTTLILRHLRCCAVLNAS